MESSEPEVLECPACRAENLAERETCRLCGKRLAPIPDRSPTPNRFGLRHAMIAIAFLAAGLAFVRAWPGLSILAGLFAGPALLRTALISRKEIRQGRMTPKGWIVTLLGSFYVVTAALIAACVTFVATCSLAGGDILAPSNSDAPFIYGAVAACLVGALVFWINRRRKD